MKKLPYAQQPRRSSVLYTVRTSILLLVSAVLLSGCTESLTGIDEEPDPGEEVQFKTVYDLEVKTHDIWINGSCDKVAGIATAGEFQYRYEVFGAGETYDYESQNFDKRTGVVYNKVAGQKIDLPTNTYRWSGLSSSQTGDISIKLYGTEWDAVIRDSRMSKRNGSKGIPFKLGSESRTITIGATKACQIQLAYEATWKARDVRI